jgi:hypothetical protein
LFQECSGRALGGKMPENSLKRSSFGEPFWHRLLSRIEKMSLLNIFKNPFTKIFIFDATSLPKWCRTRTENQEIIENLVNGGFYENHRFIAIERWFLRNQGNRNWWKSMKNGCWNWVWKGYA